MPELLVRLEALHRRYDGPVPPADPAHLHRAEAGPRVRLFQRLAAETVRAAARWRRGLPARAALTDPRLARLGARLAFYRHAGLAWVQPTM